MKLDFLGSKEELSPRGRIPVDTIRLISSKKKSDHKIGRRILQSLIIALGFMIIFSLSFAGTAAAEVLKDKSKPLKMFEQGKYLVLFQNNSEMRPTGGFIGSFAVVSFNNYKITKVDFNTNIYKLDNAFTSSTQVVPPSELANVSQDHWALRDSNFAVDFPTASQDIQWFYEHETGNKIDGVVAVNATLVQELLKITGPIYLDKYQTEISYDNFFVTLAQKIEKEYFYDMKGQAVNEPKTILKDMMPILMEKSFKLPKPQLLKFALSAMSQKLVEFQSNDPVIEQSILDNNWGGAIEPSGSDYLAVNNANITDLTTQKNGGAKTSLSIKESIDYKVDNTDGNLVGTLNLTRSHSGTYAWPDGVNINWTRILVPNGSTLIKAELNGEDISNKIKTDAEAGKTVFGLWINTNPATSNVLNISYNLPISESNYHLQIQKQPGNTGDSLTATYLGKVIYNGVLNKDENIQPK